MVKITIDNAICKKCGTCVMACPYRIFVRKAWDSVPTTEFNEPCVSCGHCVAICPEGAITHSGVPDGRIKPVDKPLQPAPEQVLALLRARRSVRAFQDKPVERALIERVIDGANTGPTPHNAHRVEYVVVQDRTLINKMLGLVAESYGKIVILLNNPAMFDNLPAPLKEKLTAARPQLSSMGRIFNSIKAGDDMLQRGTPSLLVLHAPKVENDPFGAKIDVTIAIQNASLVCSSLGLGSCELGYIESVQRTEPQIQKMLGIPDDHAIYGMMAIGYPKYRFKNWIAKQPAKITWK